MARKPKDVELNALSKQYKIQYKTLKEIRDKYEKRDDWFETFCENPYFLTKFPRWGFFRCDLYASKIGFDMNSDERMLASVRHIIEEKSDGNTILQIKTVLEGMIKLLKRKDTSYMLDVIKRKHKELGYVLYDKDIKVTEESSAMYITLETWRDIEKEIYKLCKNSEKYQMKDKEFIDKALEKIEAGLEFPLNEKQKQAFLKIPHGKVNVLTGLGGCYEEGTEVLTRDGWINIEDWNGQEIMEAETENKVGITGKFSKPIQFHKYKSDQFYRMKGNTVDLTVSENHNNLIVSEKHFYKKFTTKELFEKWNEKSNKINMENKTATNFINIPDTFEWYGEGIDYTDDYIRLKIAIFADGYFGFRAKSKPNMCHINLKKDHKKKRLEMLLDKNSINYTIQKNAEGYSRYYFEADNSNKIIDKSWFFKTNKHQREIIIEEIMLWDGSFGKGERIGTFTSIEKETIDTVQLIAHSLGYRANICQDKRTFEKYKNGVCYCINFSKTKFGHKVFECSNANSFEKIESNSEYMYCFTTTSGNFVIRQNNKIYVSGNSGKSYTTRAILDVLDELGETYTLLAPTGTAVKVLSNSTKRSAMTVHRRFHIDQEKIFDDWLIIDESSMLSLEHFNLLLQRLSECPIKLLLIGDINQLVSIGVGTPFRDIIEMIETGIIDGNVVHLTEIMRSKKDSAISHVCKMFTEHGEYSRLELHKDLKGVEFIPINKTNFTSQIEGIIKQRDFRMADTFVLSPFNVREFGTNVINNHIQKVFNKGNMCYKDDLKQYKIGDYLMHTKNNAKMDIFNGERIRLVGSQKCVDDDGREVVEYVCQKVDDNVMLRYDEETLRKETMLSYAISIHKSQGASLNNTILVLDSSHFISLSRNSVYTGMSRASKNLIVLYDEKALNIASKKNEVQKRKTFLREMSERRRKQK